MDEGAVLVDSETPAGVKRNRVKRVEDKLLKTESANHLAKQPHPGTQSEP
ncbi:hypothetical protein SBV1_1450030 [Verrucomicrobia bacterium]|nr:hypothetical protein SBV1_1450030 [Verrucomicrobiota bacterium]